MRMDEPVRSSNREMLQDGGLVDVRKALSQIRLGSAPDSWGVWFPDDPKQVPWDRFLDELARAGYRWLELGPHGYLPNDPAKLTAELARRNLKVSGGGVFGALHREAQWEKDVEEARKVAALVQAMDARYVIYLPELYRDLDGVFTDSPSLTAGQWKLLLGQMTEMGRMLRDDYGVTLVFHPHADSHVGTEAEVERFLDGTDADAVSLCLDTGHISYCGGDNLSLIQKFQSRIGYVHLKQVDPDVLAQVKAEQLPFAEAVRLGVMCEPPRGVPEMQPLLEELAKLDAALFAIVEQDMYPCEPDTPLPIATRTRHYLWSCGLQPSAATPGAVPVEPLS